MSIRAGGSSLDRHEAAMDWHLAHDIVGHEVKSTRQIGWTAIKNGELWYPEKSVGGITTVWLILSLQLTMR